jgi:hypothetical protein
VHAVIFGYPQDFLPAIEPLLAGMFPRSRITVPWTQPDNFVRRKIQFSSEREARQAHGAVMALFQNLEAVGAHIWPPMKEPR